MKWKIKFIFQHILCLSFENMCLLLYGTNELGACVQASANDNNINNNKNTKPRTTTITLKWMQRRKKTEHRQYKNSRNETITQHTVVTIIMLNAANMSSKQYFPFTSKINKTLLNFSIKNEPKKWAKEEDIFDAVCMGVCSRSLHSKTIFRITETRCMKWHEALCCHILINPLNPVSNELNYWITNMSDAQPSPTHLKHSPEPSNIVIKLITNDCFAFYLSQERTSDNQFTLVYTNKFPESVRKNVCKKHW